MFLFSLLLLLLFESIFYRNLSSIVSVFIRSIFRLRQRYRLWQVSSYRLRLYAGKREEYVAYFLIENTENVNVVIYFVISRQAATRVRRRTNFLTLTY